MADLVMTYAFSLADPALIRPCLIGVATSGSFIAFGFVSLAPALLRRSPDGRDSPFPVWVIRRAA